MEDVVVRLRRLRGLPEEGNEAAIEELLQDTDDPSEPGLTGEPSSENGFEQDAVSPELWEAFRAEADEYTQSISAALRRIKKKPADGETLLGLRRVVHTLKGAAAVVGLRSAAEIAHRMEDLLDLLHDEEGVLADDTLGLLFETADVLENLTTDRPSGQMKSRLEKLHQEYGRRLPGASGEPPASAQAAESKAPLDAPAPGEAPVDPEILEAFALQAEEHLQAISGLLRDLAQQPKDKGLTLEVRRRVHTLKGAAAMTDLTTASGLAHRMEDLLDQVHEDKIELADAARELLFTSTDVLEDLAAKGGANSQSQDQLSEILGVYDEILGALENPLELTPDDALERLLEEDHVIDLTQMPKAPSAAKLEAAEAAASAAPGQLVRIPLDRLDELVRLVSELVVNRSTFEQHFSRYVHEVDELNLSVERLKRIAVTLETEHAVGALVNQQDNVGFAAGSGPAFSARKAEDDRRGDFDTLEFDRYSDIHLLSRDLTETSSDIGSVSAQFGNIIGDFDSYLNRLGRLSSEVQDKLIRFRMVPLGSLAGRLHRTVRVTASKALKLVDLTIEGENVELDKVVIEEMAGSLEHLLRNAVDHGIERPELRRANRSGSGS